MTRRAGRRRDKVDDRKSKPKKKRFGNVKNAFKQIGIASGALVIAEAIAAYQEGGAPGVWKFLFGDNKNKNEGGEAGGIFTGPDSGYNVTLHGTELVIPLNNKVTDGISGNEVTSRGSTVSNIFKNGGSSFALNNKSNIFSSSPVSSS